MANNTSAPMNFHIFDDDSYAGLTTFDRVIAGPAYDDHRKVLAEDLATISGENVTYSDNPCTRCKRKTVFISTLQLRSADEGMTQILICNTCSRRVRL